MTGKTIDAKTVLIAVAAFAAAGALVWFAFSGPGSAPEKTRETVAEEKPAKIADARPTVRQAPATNRVARPAVAAKPAAGLFTDMDEEDRKVALAIQEALDNEDIEALKKLVDRARGNKNAAIRQLMVEALQWFDVKAMFELSKFLADEDEEVRKAAVGAWDLVLNNLEDEGIKAALLVESLQVVADEDDADTVCSQFHTIDQKLAVDSMVKLLYGTLSVSKPARKKILEAYEFITGEEYVNAQAARAWLRENYTPPDKD